MKRLLAAVCTFCLGLFLAPSLVAQTAIMNHLTMNQWVQATDNGSLQGRIVLPKAEGQLEALEGVNVAISAGDGKVLRAKTNAKGAFLIRGVEPGIYGLTARGDNVFACCAMHVIASDPSLTNKFPQVAEVAVANVDYTVVNTAVIRYMPPNVVPPSVSISSAELEGLATRVCGNDMFRVALNDGSMKGRLHLAGAKGAELQSVQPTNVFIFKDAMQIDRTLTDESGQFAFENLQPGQYSLLAVGADGIGLIGFELIDEAARMETARKAGTNRQLVGIHQHGCCPEFAMQIAPMPDVACCVEEVIVTETIVDGGCGGGCEVEPGCEDICDGFCNPLAGGGMVPGYGGGGYGGGGGGYGGGGGGGGLGGLGALVGLGVLAAASSNDNGAVILPPVVASPSLP